ncbi:GNAT domain-containing protein [Hypoxylon sp. NC0597]|nr:GNAT domain-containing protein [Hypoxylon sp. NC0597]
MKLNENIAISTSKVLLVPYDAHHVPQYHQWMEDATIREATASERLTLAEEYENQVSWRAASDKLTFIICEPPPQDSGPHSSNGDQHRRVSPNPGRGVLLAGVADEPRRMVGDVNLFLAPWEDDDNDDDDEAEAQTRGEEEKKKKKTWCAAEVDIMIADPKHRGKGFGRAAVATFLFFVRRHLEGILAEYAGTDVSGGGSGNGNGGGSGGAMLRELVAKIHASNTGSIALFKSLGFRQRGDVNYFGEIQMVLEGFGSGDDGPVRGAAWAASVESDGYTELVYDRSRLEK